MNTDKLIGWAIVAIGGAIGLFFLYLVVVWTPVYLYAESECLRAGYPKTQVSVGLERYCTNLDGAVTVLVKKQ